MSEEGPADLHLAPLRVIAVEARHADDVAGPAIKRDEHLARAQQHVEVGTEDLLSIAVLHWVLFPDARIGRGGVQSGEVVGAERPQPQESAAEAWLVVEPSVWGRTQWALLSMRQSF